MVTLDDDIFSPALNTDWENLIELQPPRTGPPPPIPPPPFTEKDFNTKEDALDELKLFAKANGFAVTTARSKRPSKYRKKFEYICDRGPLNVSKKRLAARKTTSKRINCPFRANIQSNAFTWKLIIKNPCHNHEPSLCPSAHPSHRRDELNAKLPQIKPLLNEGVDVETILLILRREDPDSALISRDIYNLRHRLHREFLHGRTPTQALLSILPQQGEWQVRYKTNDNKALSTLFITHRTCLAKLRQNPHLLVMDCTYKTNRFNMPLMNIVGVEANNASFFVGFGFISDEQQPSFEFLLRCLRGLYSQLNLPMHGPETILTDKDDALINAIAAIFPDTKSMICLWHINKNILSKAKWAIHRSLLRQISSSHPEFDSQIDLKWEEMLHHWMAVVLAFTEEEMLQKWREFVEYYKEEVFKELISYIEKMWLATSTARRFLRCFTNHYRHFGQCATSRGEGIHRHIKSHIKSSTGDLYLAFQGIEQTMEHLHTQNSHKIAAECVQVPYHLKIPLFYDVLNRVSQYALNKVVAIFQAHLPPGDGKEEIKKCTGTTSIIYGLPCIHIIKRCHDSGQSLKVEDFHSQWHLPTAYKPVDPVLRVREPEVIRAKGRPKGSKNREPSAFEITERNIQKGTRRARKAAKPATMEGSSQPRQDNDAESIYESAHEVLQSSDDELPQPIEHSVPKKHVKRGGGRNTQAPKVFPKICSWSSDSENGGF